MSPTLVSLPQLPRGLLLRKNRWESVLPPILAL